jgi:ribose-phosphate pyrophosphokinase
MFEDFMKDDSLVCVALQQNYRLANALSDFLHAPLYIPAITQFADGELEVLLWQEFLWHEKEVLLILPTAHCVHDELVKAFFLIDALKQRGVKKITWLLPYCGYARQCKDSTGVYQGHMAVVARMIEASGVDALMVIEPHDDLVSLFSIPVFQIRVHECISYDIKTRFGSLEDICLVAPDDGALERVTLIAKELAVPLVHAVKKRFDTNQTRVMGIQGYAGYKRAIIIDDIIDTGSTALSVAQSLLDLGVDEIHGYFVHGIFSQGIQKILDKNIYRTLAVSPTVSLSNDHSYDTVKVFDIHHAYVQIRSLLHR